MSSTEGIEAPPSSTVAKVNEWRRPTSHVVSIDIPKFAYVAYYLNDNHEINQEEIEQKIGENFEFKSCQVHCFGANVANIGDIMSDPKYANNYAFAGVIKLVSANCNGRAGKIVCVEFPYSITLADADNYATDMGFGYFFDNISIIYAHLYHVARITTSQNVIQEIASELELPILILREEKIN